MMLLYRWNQTENWLLSGKWQSQVHNCDIDIKDSSESCWNFICPLTCRNLVRNAVEFLRTSVKISLPWLESKRLAFHPSMIVFTGILLDIKPSLVKDLQDIVRFKIVQNITRKKAIKSHTKRSLFQIHKVLEKDRCRTGKMAITRHVPVRCDWGLTRRWEQHLHTLVLTSYDEKSSAKRSQSKWGYFCQRPPW